MPYMRVANKKWLAEHGNFTGESNSIGWRCKKTGKLMLAEITSRTIWDNDGPGPCASSQGVQLVVEAYCPVCGSKPKVRQGEPINENELVSI